MTSPMAGRSAVDPTLDALIADTRRQLRSVGIEPAEPEAVWLIEHALGLTGLKQVVDHEQSVGELDVARVQACVARRVAREPLQYILGTQEFCGLEFEVNPAVLIPRPETELLVQEVVRRLPQGSRRTIVDAGTGSGCIAVTLARSVPRVQVLATDMSAAALDTAKRNARRHNIGTSVTWLQGDWLAPLNGLGYNGSVATIVANPPYISESEWAELQPEVSRYEPRLALVAGPRGTEMHERLLVEAVSYLMPGGFLVMELGQGQSKALCARIETMTAYEQVHIVPDDAGIERIVVVRRTR